MKWSPFLSDTLAAACALEALFHSGKGPGAGPHLSGGTGSAAAGFWPEPNHVVLQEQEKLENTVPT